MIIGRKDSERVRSLILRAADAEENAAYWRNQADVGLELEQEAWQECSTLTDYILDAHDRYDDLAAIALQIAAYEQRDAAAQIADRDDEITRLKADLARLNPPRKRQGKKQEVVPVPGSEAQA